MNDFSDVGVAETFLHHPVLILPVTRGRQVIGVITRADFFYRLGTRFLAHGDAA
jgi:CBS domain-containing protein